MRSHLYTVSPALAGSRYGSSGGGGTAGRLSAACKGNSESYQFF